MIIHNQYTHGGDIYRNDIRLDFSVNVNPLGTPVEVRDAVRNVAEHLEAYPDPYCEELRNRIAEALDTNPDRIICGNGAAELIYQFVAAVRPAETLLPVPSFSDYEAALSASNCKIRFFPLVREEGFSVTERILSEIREDTGLLMLCSPNNPTGRLVDRELLLKILERCRKTKTWLFLDECFGELAEEESPSLVSELLPDDRVFLLRAFTKTYAMAGLRLGFAVCPNRELLRRISESSQPWNVSSVSQAAGIAALSCRNWAEKARTLVREEKKYLTEELSRLGISVLPGDANYFLLQGVQGLYEGLLPRGILIRNCENYRGLLPGDCRVAVKKHEENEALIRAVREVLHA